MAKHTGQPVGKIAKDTDRDFIMSAELVGGREAIQVHGGYGDIEEIPVARFYRLAKS